MKNVLVFYLQAGTRWFFLFQRNISIRIWKNIPTCLICLITWKTPSILRNKQESYRHIHRWTERWNSIWICEFKGKIVIQKVQKKKEQTSYPPKSSEKKNSPIKIMSRVYMKKPLHSKYKQELSSKDINYIL